MNPVTDPVFLIGRTRGFVMALTVAAAALLSSCSGGVIGHVDVDQQVPAVTVQGNPAGGILPPSLDSFALDITQEASYQNGDFDYAKTIQLDRLTLTITSDSEGAADTLEDGRPDHFNFLNSLQVLVIASFNGQSQEVLVASLPAGDPQLSNQSRQIVLQMTGADILGYVEAVDGYQVQVRATGNLPPDNVIFNGQATYRVGVGFS
jgi:hypothetical protein